MSRKRILIVEDEAIVALDIKDRLEYLGYNVVAIIPNGFDAINKAHETAPDLILMDVMLQGEMDGVQASEEINKFLDIPIIFLTANSDDKTLQRAKITGPFGYLLKPFEERELHSTIEMALYRHQLEQEVKGNRRWLSTTLNSIGDAVISTDENGNIFFMNPIAEALTGWSEEKAKGKKLMEVLNIVDRNTGEVSTNPVDIVQQTKGIISLDENTELINKNGKHIPIEDSAAPIKNLAGKVCGTVIVFRDVTEKILAEHALKLSEARYYEILNSIREGIGVVDVNEIITYCNPAFANIFEFEQSKDLIGKSLLDFVPPDQIEKVRKQGILRKQNIPSEYELDIITEKGHEKTIEASIIPRFDADNNFIGSIGGILDITERKQAELQLQEYRDHLEDVVKERTEKLSRANEQLKAEISERKASEEQNRRIQEELERAKRMETLAMLAGGVAHDLNNMLGPLVGYPELIIAQLPPDSPLRKQIQMMEDSAKQASNVIQDLLALARHGRYEMNSINLNQVLECYINSISFKKFTSQFPDIKINLKLNDKLKYIRGSKVNLQKMLMNLIVNAFDAIQDSGIINIVISTQVIDKLIGGFDNIEQGEYIILKIKDNGVGIDPINLDKIFEPFFSMNNKNKKSSGIGLSVVYSILKDHKGYYDVFSSTGEGTEFILYFPVSCTTEHNSEVEIDIKGTESVLVIDDNLNQKKLAESLVSSLGYEVNSVNSGREAIEYLKKNPVNILVLDMVLEDDFDGLDTYREIIALYPEQKAIIVSGFACTDRVEVLQALGVEQYIAKPFTRSIIGKAIRTELDKNKTPASV